MVSRNLRVFCQECQPSIIIQYKIKDTNVLSCQPKVFLDQFMMFQLITDSIPNWILKIRGARFTWLLYQDTAASFLKACCITFPCIVRFQFCASILSDQPELFVTRHRHCSHNSPRNPITDRHHVRQPALIKRKTREAPPSVTAMD